MKLRHQGTFQATSKSRPLWAQINCCTVGHRGSMSAGPHIQLNLNRSLGTANLRGAHAATVPIILIGSGCIPRMSVGAGTPAIAQVAAFTSFCFPRPAAAQVNQLCHLWSEHLLPQVGLPVTQVRLLGLFLSSFDTRKNGQA